MSGVVACVGYAEGQRIADVPLDDVSEILKVPGRFVWIGLHEPTPEVLAEIQREFGLHELAIEFQAGENYEKWYLDQRWAPYWRHFEWARERVGHLDWLGADPTLIRLAKKCRSRCTA